MKYYSTPSFVADLRPYPDARGHLVPSMTSPSDLHTYDAPVDGASGDYPNRKTTLSKLVTGIRLPADVRGGRWAAGGEEGRWNRE
jgi:hypothetical protein